MKSSVRSLAERQQEKATEERQNRNKSNDNPTAAEVSDTATENSSRSESASQDSSRNNGRDRKKPSHNPGQQARASAEKSAEKPAENTGSRPGADSSATNGSTASSFDTPQAQRSYVSEYSKPDPMMSGGNRESTNRNSSYAARWSSVPSEDSNSSSNTDSDSTCLLYTSPSPRDATLSRMPSSA